MNREDCPIPARLNLLLAAGVVVACLLFLWSAGKTSGIGWIAAVAAAYALVMYIGYALSHEAEHDMLHPNQQVNDLAGTMLNLFFPASFELRRHAHLGHHHRNRGPDEAFDLIFPGENRLWKRLQFYGILTGFFWIAVALSNLVAIVNPKWLTAPALRWNRATGAMQSTLSPKQLARIRIESLAALLLHASMILVFHIPLIKYLTVMAGFGFLWSTLQYIHHYGAPRDVQTGAWNLRASPLLGRLWLNHHLHLIHHLHPALPWIHLPNVEPNETPTTGFLAAYLRMWKGPQPVEEDAEPVAAEVTRRCLPSAELPINSDMIRGQTIFVAKRPNITSAKPLPPAC